MARAGLVSLIIPTKNSEATLDRCLLSCSRQSYSNFEIILVDDFSKDKTVEIASKYSTRLIQTRAARTEARNIGAANSTGEWILSLDSDMEASPTVIEECVTLSRAGYEAAVSAALAQLTDLARSGEGNLLSRSIDAARSRPSASWKALAISGSKNS